MTRITKDLNEEMARIEEPAKTEENPRMSRGPPVTKTIHKDCQGDGSIDNINPKV